MARDRHVAVPGEMRPVHPPDGQPVEPVEHQRDGLDDRRVLRLRPRLDHAEQGGAEGQHAGSVARRAFGEQDDAVAGGEARDQLVTLPPRLGAAAGDEDGTAEAGDGADQRPGTDLRLGDEAGLERAPQHEHVCPGGVVGHEHHRARRAGRRGSLQRDADAGDAAVHPVIGLGDGDGRAAADQRHGPDRDGLDGDAEEGPEHQQQEPPRRADLPPLREGARFGEVLRHLPLGLGHPLAPIRVRRGAQDGGAELLHREPLGGHGVEMADRRAVGKWRGQCRAFALQARTRRKYGKCLG